MPRFKLSTSDLQAIEDWKEDGVYSLRLTVRQTTPTDNGEAEFEVLNATGKLANTRERSETNQASDDFEEAAEKARQDVLTPSTGSESGEAVG